MSIRFDDLPIEPTVTIISPNGTDLITTNNPIAILYARLEIKHHKWEGYKIRTASGYIIDIKTNGKLSAWPEDEVPGDVFDRLIRELI
jgi:hypothetical protein